MTTLKAEDVAGWLRENPAFFEEYGDLLSEIYVPHPHGGHAIPLSDRQVLTLRDKARSLEGKLSELIQFGEENDVISEKVHRLCVAMLSARTLDSLLHELYYNLREDFAIPRAALRVWRGTGDRAEFGSVSSELRDYLTELDQPFCGPNTNFEVASWFGEAAPHVKSVAMMPLAEMGETFGVFVLASDDLLRFHPDMGTLYLKRIAELVSAAMLRFV